MAELRLISDHERQLKPLVEAELKNELRLLQIMHLKSLAL